jgi:uncharacterized protein (DUF2141 family)
MKRALAVAMLLLLEIAPAKAQEETRLVLSFSQPPDAEAPILAALFADEASFEAREGPVRSASIRPGADLNWQPEPLPVGAYALLAFQDLNGDGSLNLDDRGRPLEPFTATGRLGRGQPRYSQAVMEFDAGDHHIEVNDWRYRKRRTSRR